jgi:hypothetical protein
LPEKISQQMTIKKSDQNAPFLPIVKNPRLRVLQHAAFHGIALRAF